MRRIVSATNDAVGGTNVVCQPGLVRITNLGLFARPGGNWTEFLIRVFGLPSVESVEIDRRCGTAVIRFSPQQSLRLFLEDISAVLSAETTKGRKVTPLHLPTGLEAATRLWLTRRGTRVSTWQILHELPGRLRVRDLRLRGDASRAGRIVSSLRLLRGIKGATARTLTGSVVIHYQQSIINRDTLLVHLDHWDEVQVVAQPPALVSRKMWASAHATLGLAVAGTLFYPPLLPVSGALLVLSNLRTFRNAFRELCQGRLGVPLLHTSIVGMTLATGGFIASSLMNWLLLYWEERQSRLAAEGHQLLMHSVAPPTATAWVVRDGVELETPVARLEPGTIIRIRAGEWVPVDGQIVSGTAALTESPVRGVSGLVSRGPGDEILAGSHVVEGELLIETTRTREATLAGKIVRTLTATATAAGAVHGTRATPTKFAERAVPPTLLTAGLGLFVADPVAAGAVLRPDYATGPGLGNAATFIDRLGNCIDEGMVVRDPDAFRRMAEADTILLDHQILFDARELQLEDIHVVGDLPTGQLLVYAECAVRPYHDRRVKALQDACEVRDRVPLAQQGTYRAGRVEFVDRGKHIRVEGLTRSHIADADDSVRDENWPLRVFCDGSLAGILTFCAGADSAVGPAIEELRSRGGLDVEVVCSGSVAEANRLADWLGVDDVRICSSDSSKAQLIEVLRQSGRHVVYVGDCRKNPLAARAADLAIFPGPPEIHDAATDIEATGSEATGSDATSREDPSGIWLLHPDFGKLLALREIAKSLESQSRLNCNLILAPNIVCVAGAFLFGFTSLAVVVLSNLGTFTMYTRSLNELRQAERRLQNRRQRRLGHRLETSEKSASSAGRTVPAPAREQVLPNKSRVPDSPILPALAAATAAVPANSVRTPLETSPVAETIETRDEILAS
jgi:Cu2+-exporting ATPase